MTQSHRNKSLQDLDCQDWGEPTNPSHLVTECHRLRRVPLRDFTAENLRIMIGQNIGLAYLVPLALECLHDDPFAEGDFYPCDLLVSVLRSDAKFWQTRPELRERLVALAERAIELFPRRPDVATEIVIDAVTRAFGEFKRRQAQSA
jgi:CDI immunity proteins